jgi:hypothetical protein
MWRISQTSSERVHLKVSYLRSWNSVQPKGAQQRSNNVCNSKLVVVTILYCLLENSRVLQNYLTNEWLYTCPDHLLSSDPSYRGSQGSLWALCPSYDPFLRITVPSVILLWLVYNDWLSVRPACLCGATRPPFWSFRDTMPLLNVFSSRKTRGCFKYRQHPTVWVLRFFLLQWLFANWKCQVELKRNPPKLFNALRLLLLLTS